MQKQPWYVEDIQIFQISPFNVFYDEVCNRFVKLDFPHAKLFGIIAGLVAICGHGFCSISHLFLPKQTKRVFTRNYKSDGMCT